MSDRPASETKDKIEAEITLDMIEVGEEAAAEYDYRFDRESDMVVRIYIAMRMKAQR